MGQQLKEVNILLGVSGCIAAYKAADLASKLTSQGASVRCVMTDSACQLVGPKTFEALTSNQVYTKMWSEPNEYSIEHISLAESADIIVLAPATANIIGKITNGICDDLLSTIMCAGWNKPTLIAPAMNNNMWANPAVQKNIETLGQMNCEMIGPETGKLACGTEAIGRMSEPMDILAKIIQLAGQL
jgi:phosphopantothenoylcysteine decarboxylase/phosphopantothenate--cysteine ligase